jgi:hypothetical protein
MVQLLAGRMKPQIASTVAQLVSTRARPAQTLELMARVAMLERKLAEQGTAPAAKAGAAGEEPVVPLWWMAGENRPQGSGDGNGK